MDVMEFKVKRVVGKNPLNVLFTLKESNI